MYDKIMFVVYQLYSQDAGLDVEDEGVLLRMQVKPFSFI